MSATVADVDFKNVVDDFNQSGWPDINGIGKLDRNSANFQNISLKLENIEWHEVNMEAPGLTHSKQVKVQTTKPNTVTTVTAAPSDAVPGSTINVVSGVLKGVPVPHTQTATIKMPAELGGELMRLDLSTNQQRVKGPFRQPASITISGGGNVKVESKPTVYQGSFMAEARFTGGVVFKTQSRSTQQVDIELMAEVAHDSGCLRKPFYYSGRALCWTVHGSMDLLLEDLEVVG